MLVVADLASASQVNKDLFSKQTTRTASGAVSSSPFIPTTRLPNVGCARGDRTWGGVPDELEGDLSGHPQAPLARALQLATAEALRRGGS